MKSQKAQEDGARKPVSGVVNQLGTDSSSSQSVRHTPPLFDDLHVRIAIRAYELYVQRGCRDGSAMEEWLEAERDSVSREVPPESSSRR